MPERKINTPSAMTPERIAEIERRAELRRSITEGPNALLRALASADDVPDLLAEVERLTAAVAMNHEGEEYAEGLPEPENRSVWLDPDVFEVHLRDDHPDDEGAHWIRSDDGSRSTWAELRVSDDPTKWIRLVPDPAVDAPPLPWTSPSHNGELPDLSVDRARDDGGVLEINGIGLAQNRIRDLMGICARILKPGAERDALQAAAQARRTNHNQGE